MAPVSLNVYDVSVNAEVEKLNKYLTAVGTGAFHGGIEVYGKEYSYGFCKEGTGIFTNPPKKCQLHHFKEAISLGETTMSEEEVAALIKALEPEWLGSDYDLLRNNCVIFSTALAKKLGANAPPAWVSNLAAAGATIQDGAMQAATAAQAAAILAAAKAGEMDSKYQITGTVQAKVSDFIVAAKAYDDEHKVVEKAAAAAQKGGELAAKAATDAVAKAKELDEKHKIVEKATEAAKQGGAMAVEGAKTAVAKAQELDEKHHIRERAAEGTKQAIFKVSEMSQKAAAQAKAKAHELDEKHHVMEKASSMCACGEPGGPGCSIQ